MSLFDVVPPENAPLYRGWRVWYDNGHYQHGIVYRETKWRAAGRDGRLLESPTPGPGRERIDGHAWIKGEVDRLTEGVR